MNNDWNETDEQATARMRRDSLANDVFQARRRAEADAKERREILDTLHRIESLLDSVLSALGRPGR